MMMVPLRVYIQKTRFRKLRVTSPATYMNALPQNEICIIHSPIVVGVPTLMSYFLNHVDFRSRHITTSNCSNCAGRPPFSHPLSQPPCLPPPLPSYRALSLFCACKVGSFSRRPSLRFVCNGSLRRCGLSSVEAEGALLPAVRSTCRPLPCTQPSHPLIQTAVSGFVPFRRAIPLARPA